MTAERPLFSKTTLEIEGLFKASENDSEVLRRLLQELRHRSTAKATSLRKKIEGVLADHEGEKGANGAGTSRAKQTDRSERTVICQGCETKLRVPVRIDRTIYSCPTCKTEFEVAFKDDVLQVVWTKPGGSSAGREAAMTDTRARELLGVAQDADFNTIKAAWRKASQQYHPDKHQGLPDRLRAAAELEMKRINEAYRFLEAATASDF